MKFTFPPESKPLDGYTIKRAIHKGGFGEVYYALSDSGKEVALKLLHDNTDVELRGVSQCLNLKHPNLVTIFDIKRDEEGDYWIIMEYVSGKCLDLALATYPTGMPMAEVQHWLAGMAAGLSYLHDKGIVHRDLKPANVFSEGDLVKIGDVGLAKFISDSRRNAQTESVGTVYYMAPEVARGHYGHEVDVYSLGVVTYEMLTGRVPFDGESTAEILMKHLSERPDLTPIPEWLRPVLARSLEKDPLKRTPSVGQFLSEFQNAVRGVNVSPDVAPTYYPEREVQAVVNTNPQSPRVPPPLPPYAEKYVRKYEKKAAKWAEKERKRADRYARKYGDANHVAYDPEARRRKWSNRAHFLIRAAAVAIAILALVRPGTLRAVFPAVMVGGGAAILAWGTWTLLGKVLPSVPEPRTPGAAPPELPAAPIFENPEPLVARPIGVAERRAPQPPPQPLRAGVEYTRDEYRGRFLDPSTPRHIALRQRMTDLTGSMTFAVVATTAITAVLAGVTKLLPDPSLIAVFASVTLLGSWTVMAATKLLEGHGHETTGRRMLFLGLGALIGAIAFWLQGAMLADLPRTAVLDPIFNSVGKHELVGASGQPTLIGSIVFFGGLFALRRWWWHADAFRSSRFRIWSVMLTAGLAFLLTWVWQFPQVWGVTLAAAISTVVQLSSTWQPPTSRPRLVA